MPTYRGTATCTPLKINVRWTWSCLASISCRLHSMPSTVCPLPPDSVSPSAKTDLPIVVPWTIGVPCGTGVAAEAAGVGLTSEWRMPSTVATTIAAHATATTIAGAEKLFDCLDIGVLRDPQDDFAELFGALQETQRLHDRLQRQHAIDGGNDLRALYERQHLLEVARAAHRRSFDANLTEEHQCRGNRPIAQRRSIGYDASGVARCLDDFRKGIAANGIDRERNAVAGGGTHAFRPLSRGDVDDGVGAQLFRALQLLIASRRRDHVCAQSLGELQNVRLHAAADAGGKHPLAARRATLGDDGAVRRQARERKRRRVFEIQVRRNPIEALFRHDDAFCECALIRHAENTKLRAGIFLTIAPSALGKDEDALALFPSRHAWARLLDLAGAVGSCDAGELDPRIESDRDEIIAAVERRGAETNEHLAGAGLGIRPLPHDDVGGASLIENDGCTHGAFIVSGAPPLLLSCPAADVLHEVLDHRGNLRGRFDGQIVSCIAQRHEEAAGDRMRDVALDSAGRHEGIALPCHGKAGQLDAGDTIGKVAIAAVIVPPEPRFALCDERVIDDALQRLP